MANLLKSAKSANAGNTSPRDQEKSPRDQEKQKLVPPSKRLNYDTESNGQIKGLSDENRVMWYLDGRKYTLRELSADRFVLGLGAVASFPAAIMLIAEVLAHGADERARLWGIVIYCFGFTFMLNASYMFHQRANSESWALMYLFADKMGINFMIAGTYTPLCLQSGCYALLGIEWGLLIFGFFWEVLLWKRTDVWKSWVDLARFIAAGWMVLLFVPNIAPYFDTWVGWAILAHGILYTTGCFFLMYRRLEFHWAIWHGLVLIAAGMFYFVAFSKLALGPPYEPPLGQPISVWRSMVHTTNNYYKYSPFYGSCDCKKNYLCCGS